MLAQAYNLKSQDIALFVEASEIMGNSDLKGGPFCGFIDVNGDYRDDIIRFDGSSALHIDIQSNNGSNFYTKSIANIPGGSWAILAGDLNNSGVNELFTAGSYNGATILSAINNKSDFEVTQRTDADFFAQNSNFVDINNDGWLDVFICDDDSQSEIYFNDGTGSLYKNNEYINMRTVPSSDNSGNYSSVWTDIDDDGDLDLYIGKCRIGVTNSTDPRRINALYINDNGTFREAAKEFGIAIGEQSWTANFGDIDNDGDQDLFMINHNARSMLFENINNENFEEIPLLESGEVINTEGYQSAFADFNNDGLLDLLIGGREDYLLLNNGNKSFVVTESPFGIEKIASFALGDSNQDGFIDVIAEYNSFSSSKSEKTKLFRAIQNGNHFISFALNGKTSNKNGIGAKLMLHGSWGKQTRIIKSGTGYGTTNSLTARFGLKDQTEIDSLVIQWPSGIKEVYTDLISDKNYLATEGICINELINITSNSLLIDCQNESVEISIDNENNYELEWSTGEQNVLTTVVSDYDHIKATISSPDGCVFHSQCIVVDTLKALEQPQLNLTNDISICDSGFPFVLRTLDNKELKWQDGSIDNDFLIEEEGKYFAQISNNCDTVNSATVTVTLLHPSLVGKDSTIIITTPMSLTLDNQQSNGTWYSDINGQDIIENGNLLITGIIESDTSFYYDFDIEQRPPLFKGGKSLNINQLPTFEFFTEIGGSMTFRVREDILLESVSVYTEIEGPRVFEIISTDNNQLVFQDTFDIALGKSKVLLNASLEPNIYKIQTNIDFNFENQQTNSPSFAIDFQGVDFPYAISDLVDLQFSSFGEVFYPYFYEWEVSPKIDDCKSDIYEIRIDIDSINNIIVLSKNAFDIFPNPFSDIINISTSKLVHQINIFNTSGQLVYKNSEKQNANISLEPEITSGAYILELITEKGIYRKVIIVE